jgi:hypothetical protein
VRTVERGSVGDDRVGVGGVRRRREISCRDASTLGVDVGERSELERTVVQCGLSWKEDFERQLGDL